MEKQFQAEAVLPFIYMQINAFLVLEVPERQLIGLGIFTSLHPAMWLIWSLVF